MNDIRHSSASALWLTPPDICLRVHKVFDGPPTFDPASSAADNIFMCAGRYITARQDGLAAPWPIDGEDHVWLNPPGGTDDRNRSLQGRFWGRLMEHRGRFGDAMFMCFNLNILQVSQGFADRGVATFPFCIFRSRLKFWRYDENNDLVEGDSPAHPNAIAYIPGRLDRTMKFREAFRDLGDVVVPSQLG